MTKSVLFTIFLLVANQLVTAQSGEQGVVSSNGGSVNSAEFELNYTIGELVIDTKDTGSYILTQGINQPNKSIDTNIGISEEESIDIEIFPNPVVNNVNIVLKQNPSENIYYQLYSIDGLILQYGELINEKNLIKIESNPHSLYILVITNKEGRALKNIKLYKKEIL